MSRLREMLGLAKHADQESVKEDSVAQEPVKDEPIKEEPTKQLPVSEEPVVSVQKPVVKTVKVVKKSTGKSSVASIVEPVVSDAAEPVVKDKTGTIVKSEPVHIQTPAFVPQQFMLRLESGIGDLSGHILQGAIGLGDKVYINGDYSHPYTVYNLNGDSNVTCAKAGSHVDLFLTSCPRRILRTAQNVTGIANPVANAYNYPGTVHEFFTDLLRRVFPNYQIHQNEPIEGVRLPATFFLYKNGKPAAAIFLVHSNDDSGRYFATKAASICAAQGFGCTHFFENYRNDTPYVVGRIKGVLGF